MRDYIIEVTAEPAYMGNPNDPLLWQFRIPARSEREALSAMNRGDCKGKPARVITTVHHNPEHWRGFV
jgi:hypothetical protein